MDRILIRHATVVSMDPRVGEIHGGDILIEGDRILAVGRALAAADACVVAGSHWIVTPPGAASWVGRPWPAAFSPR